MPAQPESAFQLICRSDSCIRWWMSVAGTGNQSALYPFKLDISLRSPGGVGQKSLGLSIQALIWSEPTPD